MGKPVFVSYEEYYLASFKLTQSVLSSGFIPDIVCAVARGGNTPANVFTYVLKSLKIPSKFVTAFLRSYNKGTSDELVKIEGYTLQPEYFWPGCKVLGLDDTFDSGKTQGVFVADIHDRNPSIMLEDIKFGVLDYKEKEYYSPPDIVRFRRLYDKKDPEKIYELPNLLKAPNYYVNLFHLATEEDNPWRWYPHETEGYTIEEIRNAMGPNIGDVIEGIRALNLPKKED